MAAAAPQIQPEAAPQEQPKQAPPAVEDWKTKPFEGGSLRAAEDAAETRGLERLGVEAAAEKDKFGEETKSFWGRAKERLFGAKQPGEVKGEGEILAEIEKSNAAYAEFKKKYDAIMASGDEAQLRGLEQDLSRTFDVLAPKVAEEGTKEADAYKKALKTGEMPQMTEMGAMLNDTSRRLQEVRGRLNGAPAAAAKEVPAPAAESVQAEKELDEAIARGTEEFEAERGAAEEHELIKASAGLPGEKLVDEYLKIRDLKSDKHGTITARGFDPHKGEIKITYEDGSEYRKYATGLELRVLPGGHIEPILPTAVEAAPAEAPKKPQAEIVEDEPEDESVDIDVSDLEEKPVEGVVSGETETKPEPAMPAEEPGVVVSPEAQVPSFLEKLDKELATFDLDKAKDDLALNFKIGTEVGKGSLEAWKRRRASASDISGFKRMLTEDYDIPADEIGMVPDAELATRQEQALSAFDRLIEAGEAELVKAETPPTPVPKMEMKTSEQGATVSGEIGGDEIQVEDADVIEATPVAAEPVPEAAESPAPEAPVVQEAKPAQTKEKPPKKLKNPYDVQSLLSLQEHLAWRKERLSKPGRFREGSEELAAEKRMIAQMEESVARRASKEAAKAETPKAEPAPEPLPEAPTAQAAPEAAPVPSPEEEAQSLAFLENYGPEFTKVAGAFLEDKDPASKMTVKKAKTISALDLAKLFVKVGAIAEDAGPAIAQGFLEDANLLKAAREKLASEVEALRTQK